MSDIIEIIDNSTQDVIEIIDNNSITVNSELDSRSGINDIEEQGTDIAFETDLGSDGNDYVLHFWCHDLSGKKVFCTITNKTESGFTAVPDADCTIEWDAKLIKDANKQGIVAITTSGYIHTFTIPYSVITNYIPICWCYDSRGREVFYTLIKSVGSFAVTPDADCTLEFDIIRKK
jgi:hypothetical protein